MKKLFTHLVLLSFLFSFDSNAQYITIEGNVSNNSGQQIEVVAQINDFFGSLIVYSTFSDSLGNYSLSDADLDSFLVIQSPVLSVYIIDCYNDTILQSVSGPFQTGQIIPLDFDYCPAIQNPCNIAASFTITQINPITQTFVPSYAYIVDNSIGTDLTYSWDFGDGTSGAGSNISHSYAGNGPYALCLTIADTAGCVDTFCDTLSVNPSGVLNKMAPGFFIQIGDGSLGTSELEGKLDISIYPNPAKDQLTISMETIEVGNVQYQLTDISGRLVKQKNMESTIEKVDLSNLSKGNYLLYVLYGNEIHTEKILIQ